MSAFVQINKLWFKYCFDLKYDNDYNINGNKIQTDLKTNNLPFRYSNTRTLFIFSNFICGVLKHSFMCVIRFFFILMKCTIL